MNHSLKIIESAQAKAAGRAAAAAPFYAAAHPAVVRTVALFWSVFGPAARYDFGNPAYAYAAPREP